MLGAGTWPERPVASATANRLTGSARLLCSPGLRRLIHAYRHGLISNLTLPGVILPCLKSRKFRHSKYPIFEEA